MTKEYWVAAALTNDALVAELLLRLKQSDSSYAHPPPATATTGMALVGWGHRKSRSRPPTTNTTATATATATAAVNGCRKEKQQQRGSPTTPLTWSGAGASTSDGYDESIRPSDLSSGGRSSKAAFANEGASTCSYNKSKKRKSFVELKEEEGFLLKERVHLNKELASMRVTLNQQMATSENLKRIKIDLHQNPEKQKESTPEHKPQDLKRVLTAVKVNESVQTLCRVEVEIKNREKGFVLPDLNMTPSEEELVTVIRD